MRNWYSMSRVALVVFAACAMLSPAGAVEQPGLYTVEVDWDRSVRGGRERAYRDGLERVIVRITGDETAAMDPALRTLFPEPSRLVLGYQEGMPGRLLVSFDGVEIGAQLRAAGWPVWGSDRPLTLIWLAVERTDGTRVIVGDTAAVTEAGEPVAVAAVDAIRTALLDAGERRGIPLRFPRLDGVDLDAVTGTDIWGAFSGRLRSASRRYGADSLLVGRVRETAPLTGRWDWFFAGDSRSIPGTADSTIDTVTAALASQFASSGAGSADVRIAVTGITDLRSFAVVSRFLRTQSLLSAVRTLRASGDEMLFSVDALTGRERLAQILEGDVLERVADPLDGRVPFAPPVGSAGPRFADDPRGASPLPAADLRYRYRGGRD